MKLTLVRHGQAEHSSIDPGLTDSGAEAVRRMAGHLLRITEPVRIVHSTKRRARETAEILGATLDITVDETRGLTPHDPVEDMAGEVNHATEDLLLVSHLPWLDRFLDVLAFPKGGGDRFVITPGSAVGLERTDMGNGGFYWRLRWFLSPEVMP